MSQVDLFQGFTVEQLRLLAFGTERQWHNSGSQLFQDGEPSDGGYVVASGQIDIITWRGERQIILDSCREAALIGELALLTKNNRVGAALARVDSEVMFIPRSLFHRMLREYPEMAAMLHERIAANVRMIMRDIDVVGGKMSSIASLESMAGGRKNPHRIKREEEAKQPAAIEHRPVESDPASSPQSRSKRASTGTWSEGLYQPRASLSTTRS